ncbi:MAG: hypothetical protein KAJ73_00215 [Zetaproteobacteria bacterium]|nr:hypothetical protein [Zetaproteobacteria bacterium]
MAKKQDKTRLRIRKRKQSAIEHNVDKAIIEEEVKKQLDAYNLSEFKDAINEMIVNVSLHNDVLESMGTAVLSAAGATSNPRIALDELMGNLILSFAPMNGGMDRNSRGPYDERDLNMDSLPEGAVNPRRRDGRAYLATISRGLGESEEQTHPVATSQPYRYSIISYNLPEPGQALFPREGRASEPVIVTYEAMRYATEVVPFMCERVEHDNECEVSYHTVYMMFVTMIAGLSCHGDINEAADDTLACAQWDGEENGYDAMYDGISEAAEIVGRSLSDNEVDESDEDVLSALSAGTEEMDIEVEEPTASPRVRPRRMRGRRGR